MSSPVRNDLFSMVDWESDCTTDEEIGGVRKGKSE